MKNECRICFELYSRGKDGERTEPFGLAMTVGEGETNREIEYQELASSVNKERILQLACLDSTVKAEDMSIITPEEYDEKYGVKDP